MRFTRAGAANCCGSDPDLPERSSSDKEFIKRFLSTARYLL
jgi:hypothetical protein